MNLSIRYKLLIGFTFFVALSSIVQAVVFVITREYISEQISNDQKEKAQGAANEIGKFFAENEDTTVNLSQVYKQATETKASNITDIIRYEFISHIYLRKVTFLSTTGRELIAGTRTGKTPDDKLNFEIPSEEFLMALDGKTNITKVYYVESELGPHINMYAPIFTSKDKVGGVIKLQINLTNLWDIIAAIKKGENGFAYVVDERGRLIVHPDLDFVLQRPILTDREIIKTALQEKNTIYVPVMQQYVNERHVLVAAHAVKIPKYNWLIVFEQPEKEAYSVLIFLRTIFITTLVGSFVMLLVISFILSQNLTRAIQLLQHGTKRIEKGDLETRLTIKSGDEIEALANSFNTMAQSMQDTFANLEMQKKRSDKTAELLLRRDMDVRRINDELEEEKERVVGERNRLELTLAGISDAVLSLDLSRKIVTFNKAAEVLLGVSKEDALGKTIESVLRIYEANKEIMPSEYTESTINDGIIFKKENIKVVTRTINRQIDLIVGKIPEANRINLGCIITFHDISKERELEAMRLDFVSMAAHELRTPLTTIKSYLSVFMQENLDRLSEEQKMFLHKIQVASIQLASLIENLLDVTKIEKGVFTVKMAPVDWVPLVQSLITDFGLRAGEKNIEVVLTPPQQQIPKVNVDNIRIIEVILNLMSNAIAYTPAGGKIHVWIEYKNNEVITHIQDTGEGIPQDAMKNMFTKFFRIVGKLTQGTKGTGLGLYISKSIVEKHHGRIWVTSEGIGKGSTFSFTLPTVSA